jgi:hypothetical protein
MIIRECASQMVSLPLYYVSVLDSKFLSVITPNACPTVDVKLTFEDNVYLLTASIICHDTTMLKLKACLKLYE